MYEIKKPDKMWSAREIARMLDISAVKMDSTEKDVREIVLAPTRQQP